MIVYVVLNSKFKEHFLQMFQDIGSAIRCKTCKRNARDERRENNMEELFRTSTEYTQKTLLEKSITQSRPNMIHDVTDNRAPVFV